jgi:molybdopterin-guanine dinucleotide biosynthesis protein A
MGYDKAFALFEGQTLLQRALHTLAQVTADCRIVGAREKFEAYGPVVEDIYADCGPLGGIHAALQSTTIDLNLTGLNLILAVDLPFVLPDFLGYLVEEAQASGALATVPRTQDGWQPLCAVYRKGFADIAEAALREGRNAVHALLEDCDVRVLDEAELGRLGFPVSMFRNINTPEELNKS